jgi:hypothetical protein
MLQSAAQLRSANTSASTTEAAASAAAAAAAAAAAFAAGSYKLRTFLLPFMLWLTADTVFCVERATRAMASWSLRKASGSNFTRSLSSSSIMLQTRSKKTRILSTKSD